MFSQLHSAMNDAFSDYVVPMHLSLQQFSTMMRQRALDLPASSVAVVNGEIAAFWLIGLRGPRVNSSQQMAPIATIDPRIALIMVAFP